VPSIQYVVGNVTDGQFDSDYRIIPHVCNNQGVMGKGVAKALYNKWPEVKKQYLWRFKLMEGVIELGEAFPVNVGNDTFVYNMIAQLGVMSRRDKNNNPIGRDGKPPIRYTSLIKAMNTVKNFASQINGSVEIHCPKFGCGLAGGNWNVIKSIIEEMWCPLFKVRVFVLDKNELE
jgi:O-acetyl-ADP-ribose deacetylase (regulator of RNase III)